MIAPKIDSEPTKLKVCERCGRSLPEHQFAYTHSPFYRGHRIPFCHDCIEEYLKKNDYAWDAIDKLCQYVGIPFIVKEWVKLDELNANQSVWAAYSKVFAAQCYEEFGWKDYQEQYKKLRAAGELEDEIPLLDQAKIKELQRFWGHNYGPEELQYLQDFYQSLFQTQNINGGLQIDQAKKLCTLSLEIDQRIRAGDKEVDKFLSSYDKLVKTAEFTPKNVKNAVDFDSFAEVGRWLEKRGRQNRFYDGVTRDIIDETMKNIENFNQRLYINEGGIGDEITQRIKLLENATEMEENIFSVKEEYDLDEYDNAGFAMEDNEDFQVGLEEEEE